MWKSSIFGLSLPCSGTDCSQTIAECLSNCNFARWCGVSLQEGFQMSSYNNIQTIQFNTKQYNVSALCLCSSLNLQSMLCFFVIYIPFFVSLELVVFLLFWTDFGCVLWYSWDYIYLVRKAWTRSRDFQVVYCWVMRVLMEVGFQNRGGGIN